MTSSAARTAELLRRLLVTGLFKAEEIVVHALLYGGKIYRSAFKADTPPPTIIISVQSYLLNVYGLLGKSDQ